MGFGHFPLGEQDLNELFLKRREKELDRDVVSISKFRFELQESFSRYLLKHIKWP